MSLSEIPRASWRQGLPPSDAPLPSHPRAHEASWAMGNARKGPSMCPTGGPLRPHGRTTRGRSRVPFTWMPVTMKPHGRPRSVEGYILCPASLHPLCHKAVRVAWKDPPLPRTRTPITSHGWTLHERRARPSRDMDTPLQLKRSPIGPHGCSPLVDADALPTNAATDPWQTDGASA